MRRRPFVSFLGGAALAPLATLPVYAESSDGCGLPVARSDGWPVAAVDEDKRIDRAALCRMADRIAASSDANIHAVLVAHGGKLVFEQYFSGFDAAFNFPLGKVSFGFHASAIFPQDAVTIEGETRDYAGRHFCPRCGSSVFARSADEIEVNLGALDAIDQLMPTYELWTIRRESWLPPFQLARRYERDRDATSRLEE